MEEVPALVRRVSGRDVGAGSASNGAEAADAHAGHAPGHPPGHVALDAAGDPRPARVLGPESGFIRIWDAVILVLIACTVVIVCGSFALPEWRGALETANGLVDPVFAANVFVNFRVAYFDARTAQWVRSPRMIAMVYMRQWLVIDIMCAVPLGMIADLVGISPTHPLRFVPLLRVVRAPSVLRRVWARGTVPA